MISLISLIQYNKQGELQFNEKVFQNNKLVASARWVVEDKKVIRMKLLEME